MLTIRVLRTSLFHLHNARRWLATETNIPIDSSTEFLHEEQRKFGKLPEQPIPSEAEQRARYEEFLEKKVLEKPLRQQLKVETNANHGLFAFFRQLEKNGEKYYETLEEAVHGKTDSSGRSWNSFELRRKSFKDLHTLWYILLRERNLLATQKAEATRLGIPIANLTTIDREYKCRKSMARIMQIINERRLAYEGALAIKQGKSTSAVVTEDVQLHITDKQAIAATRGRGRRRGASAVAIRRANTFNRVQTRDSVATGEGETGR